MTTVARNTAEQIALSAICLDGGTQSRAELNEGWIDELAQVLLDGQAFKDPIIVFYDGTTYWLADGFHRVHAARKANRDVLDVDIRQGDQEDAIEYSCGANATHGQPRTNEDKRRAVTRFLSLPKWQFENNNVRIANKCGVTEHLVRIIRSELPADHPASTKSKKRMDEPVKPVKPTEEARIRTPEIDAGKRGKVEQAIAENPTASNREIAKDSDSSEGLVRSVRKEMTKKKAVKETEPVFPDTWNHVNGKPFDMPLPDGKPIEVPESMKLPLELRGVPAALQSSASNEWFTPFEYIETARQLMGEIDLDPASCELANRIVKATKFYTKRENGLLQTWRVDGKPSRVWLNPPYGFDEGSNQERWSHALIERYKSGIVSEAVLLVNANTEAKWFQPLYNYLICFTNHRIRFHNAGGESNQPTQGNALIYFGKQKRRFIELFRQFGNILREARPDEY